MYDYNKVQGVSEEVFEKALESNDFEDASKFTKSDAEDRRKIERLLDLREGTFENEDFYFEKGNCSCGRTLTFLDFVFTAIVDADHPKSFILHTLVGTKKTANPARHVRCSECFTVSSGVMKYGMPSSYLCRDTTTR
ncbi:hypothetical protein [Actibacterium sp. XHP0104]|uniref:hypothetical protein n=1 Tax=Actibacterium sp. XHP0104 TaxID=2984335 RepID=UPI0021E74E0E|nr:hypothetical protein [Actibacterium sp. XHP0104]MCV2881937.1 hypothetical protein [Actibacterium sp. XHP0104]